MMVFIFHAPVLPGGLSEARLFFYGKAGEEEAGMVFGIVRVFLLHPVSLHKDGASGAGQSCADGRDRFEGGLP